MKFASNGDNKIQKKRKKKLDEIMHELEKKVSKKKEKNERDFIILFLFLLIIISIKLNAFSFRENAYEASNF